MRDSLKSRINVVARALEKVAFDTKYLKDIAAKIVKLTYAIASNTLNEAELAQHKEMLEGLVKHLGEVASKKLAEKTKQI